MNVARQLGRRDELVMPVPIERERFRGVNNRLKPDQLLPGFVADAENVRMREGTIDPRLGCLKPGWLNRTNALITDVISPVVDEFYGVAVFKDPNGVEWTIQCADGLVYRCRPHNERYALAMPAGVKILGRCVPVQAFNKVWLFRGRYLPTLKIADLDTGVEDLLPLWNASDTYAATTEVAYGPFQAVSTVVTLGAGELTSASTTATVAHVAHGFADGATVVVHGATQAEYNGVYTITVIDPDTFEYTFAGSATTPATGTILVQLATLTSNGDTATVVTPVEHGYITGADITVRGADQTEYNGRFNITRVDAYTFTYKFAGSATTPATGTISVSNMILYWASGGGGGNPAAGESPDSHSTKWTAKYNILPHADDALFINNRLLVPTAYTPGDQDDYSDATGLYTKKDFIVATSVLDDLHFDFANEFRINQGSDDEIVTLAKYNQDTVIVVKERSWGVLSNVRLDLTDLVLDMRNDGYGGCAPAIAVCGKDVIFPALKRGLVSVTQNEQGKVNSVDIPFSDDIEGYVARINWQLSTLQRVAYWDDKLYWAVALDDSAVTISGSVIPAGAQWQELIPGFWAKYDVPVTAGQEYYFDDAGTGETLTNGSQVLSESGVFTAQGATVRLRRMPTNPMWLGTANVLSGVYLRVVGVNNALLVYDFRQAAWQGVDTGTSVTVKDFFLPTYNGLNRLAFTANDGWCNIYETADTGDQAGDTDSDSGQGWDEISTRVRSRGLTGDSDARKAWKRLDVVLSVWNARFTLSANTGAAFQDQTLRTDVEFSRTRYLKPFDKAPYVDGNVNLDHGTKGRGNYAVPLIEAGVLLGDGLHIAQHQEVAVRTSVRTLAHRYVQFEVANDQGRCSVLALGTEATAGQRREGVMI